jgi:hypothetical protein
MPSRILFIALLTCVVAACASARALPDSVLAEAPVFDFALSDGRHAALTSAVDGTGLVFRLAQGSAVELRVPATGCSLDRFTVSGYFRGGGPGNAGLDLKYLSFVHEGKSYRLYDEYSAEDDAYAVGLFVGEQDLRGVPGTRRGDLGSVEEIEGIGHEESRW